MSHTLHKIGVSSQIGVYSDATEVGPNQRWLFTAGTPGLHPDGTLPPDITGQSQQAWENIMAILNKAGMDVTDIVKVTTSLLDAKYVGDYAKVRKEFLKGYEPAFMLQIIPGLIWPEVLVEIEVIAAKKAD
ncbi:2-iminobutanoate/2-iminopropanoate deaminase [Pararobbsia alpina]|uniref:RidA family protein n=1 Tax=Pararobbsia alpina TaxID=621374 RepID=UPI0039A67223